MPRAGWLAAGASVAALVLCGALAGPAVLAVVGSALIVAAAALTRDEPRRVAIRAAQPLLFLVVGSLVIVIRGVLTGGVAVEDGAELPVETGPWRATVVSVSSPGSGRQPALIQLETAGTPLLSASLPRYPPVEPGDRIEVGGQVRPPADDDYGRYLARIGAVGTLRARQLEALGPSTDPAWLVERYRRSAGAGLSRAMPEPQSGLAAGIIVGLRDRVDRELAAAFTTAGVSHVVAISGWNIAIVAGIVGALLRGVSRRRRAVLTAAVIAAYVAFAGASPSVMRAALMAGVVLIARETGRAGQAAAVLGVAATLLLALDPRLVLDAGFQLSAVATAGLIAWASPIAEHLAGPQPGRLRRWLAESLGVSLAAQAATLPIVLATFGRLSLVAPAVNLLVVPAIPPAMAASATALIGGWATGAGLPDGIAVVIGLPAWAILGAVIWVVRTGAALPFASIGLDPPWSVFAGAAAALLILAVHRHLARQRTTGPPTATTVLPASKRSANPASRAGGTLRRLTAVALAGGIVSVGLVFAYRSDGTTRLVMLDVGQGDSILLEGARGARVLVDTGPDPDALLVALDERLPPWDRRLDAVILTHPHEDHVAGLALLIERYRVGQVLEPGMRGPGPGHQAALAAIAVHRIPHRTLTAGARLDVDDLVLTVLWPDAGRVPVEPPETGVGINNASLVMLGEVDGRRLLLTGDAEEAVDAALLARGVPTVELLKVAHHGSATATTGALLDALEPGLALISVGTDNSYGHPAPATLERLSERGIPVLRTDLGGDIEVTIDGQALTARAEHGATPVSSARRAMGRPAAATSTGEGRPVGVLYDRADVRSGARRRHRPPPVSRPATVVRPARTGGRRSGGLVGGAAGTPRRAGRRSTGRVSRAPPRCGQAPATG
jgi:competence protein ComEC